MPNRTMSPRDTDKIFLNLGPINPVADPDVARRMAIAEMDAYDRYPDGVPRYPMMTSGPHAGELYRTTKEYADLTSERIRSGIASSSLAKANVLFSLVELEPVKQIDTSVPASQNS